MRQATWTESGLELVESDPGPVRDGWVRMRVLANGICGTDLHLYRGELPPPLGLVPGHEVSATPFETQDGVYAIEPLTWCGRCDLCITGTRQLCESGKVFGIELAGGLADFIDVPEATLHPVDASVQPRLASLAEPLAVCVRAIHLARPGPESRVLILGAGSIGLMTGLLARERAAEVGISFRHPHQEKAAAELGLAPIPERELDAWSRDAKPDIVIETVGGQADTLRQAVGLCATAGRVVVLGVFAKETAISALQLTLREITLIGSNTYGVEKRGAEFATAVNLLPRHQAELERLQTHQFPLTALRDAFHCAADKSTGAIKVTLKP